MEVSVLERVCGILNALNVFYLVLMEVEVLVDSAFGKINKSDTPFGSKLTSILKTTCG